MAKEPPIIIKDKHQMRSWSRSNRAAGRTLALVPTMGFLHEGHLSLIRQAKNRAHLTIVSIYVNPGQFSPSEDLSTYPSDLQGDLEKLAEEGVDVVFCPRNLYNYQNEDLRNRTSEENPCTVSSSAGGNDGKVMSCVEDKDGGGWGHETWIRVERLEKGLCGKSRPVFFRGVTTIVAKLFNIVEPDVALFGKKDYQQWRIICRMVRDLDFSVDVVGSEVVRHKDGLAMSSRNIHLSPKEREEALSINQSLTRAKYAAQSGQTSCKDLKNLVVQTIVGSGGQIDYAEIVDQETLIPVEEISSPVVFCIAAWFGKVRLIDNVEINI